VIERELTSAERAAFDREHGLAADASGLITERHSGGFVLSVGGRPAGWEYRAAHRALPPAPKRRRTMAEIRARIDELEAGATELWP
jgi:hypothetical protein